MAEKRISEGEAVQEVERIKKSRYRNALKVVKEVAPNQLEEIILEAEQELSKHTTNDKPKWVHIKEYEDDIKEAIRTWGKVGGISTGLPSLDAVIGGLRKGQTFLIAGESNNGKSALAAQIAVNVSRKHKVGYISLEMLPGDNGARINHMNGGSHRDIRLDGMDIYFQSTTNITYRDLDPLFKQAKDLGIEVMMLDYLQFLGRALTLEEVGKMSQVIKKLAMDYELPFIIIVSLRKGTARNWTDIDMNDLMGTSAIGYDADNVVVVSRRDLENNFDSKSIYIKVLKLRNMDKNEDNEFLMFNWDKTRITEPVVPLHLMRKAEDGDIIDGKIVKAVEKSGETVDNSRGESA